MPLAGEVARQAGDHVAQAAGLGERGDLGGDLADLQAAMHDQITVPGRDDGVLGHDDDAVADAVVLGVGVLDAGVVEQLAAVADARVEVDDGVADVAVRADADGDLVAARRRVSQVLAPIIDASAR